ncbi:MAG TPA: hypothetical protein VGA07_01470 [Anaerolineales bacterium]
MVTLIELVQLRRLPRAILLLAPSLALAGCAVVSGWAATRPTSMPPTPLPSAIPPAGPPSIWALPFQYSFPPRFWSLGRHLYRFVIQCPELGFEGSPGAWRSFLVYDDAPGSRPTIYLRQVGLSTQPLGDPNRYYIHPEQVTVASVAFLGLGKQQAEQLTASPQCAVTVSWDHGAGSQILLAGEPYLP